MKRCLHFEHDIKRRCIENISSHSRKRAASDESYKKTKKMEYVNGYEDGVKDTICDLRKIVDAEVSNAINNVVQFYEFQIQCQKLDIPKWVM